MKTATRSPTGVGARCPPGSGIALQHRPPPIPPLLRRACSHCWQHLRWENALLRACLNGILSSVPEDFYDGFLRRSMDQEADEFDESRVLGRTLGALPGVGDGFLAGRIQAMVDAGALEVLTPAPADGPATGAGCARRRASAPDGSRRAARPSPVPWTEP